jgi:hypothetical protein
MGMVIDYRSIYIEEIGCHLSHLGPVLVVLGTVQS